ncbi:MAG: adenylate/guanylate cyclase domain-containing protein, partial [Methyloligellaceae bacterium]
MEGSQRRLAAIVLADVVNYSRMMSADEIGTLRTLQKHRSELIDPLVARHFGRIVKSIGDGLLIEFSSVLEAVNCSVAIQLGMEVRNQAVESGTSFFQFRIGIHLGDIIVENDDIFGDGVNVAARIETAAEPGGIALSDDAYRQVRDRTDTFWRHGGLQSFKNIPRPVNLWHWDTETSSALSGSYSDAGEAIQQMASSIAVLPFNNMSADPEQSYFADGITEDITTELSRLPDLLVISRNTTFAYKGRTVDAKTVCAELGVQSLLEGSVRKAGNKVRINAQLIDGATGTHLWAERYDRDLDDIFAVQDDVTHHIVAALECKITSEIHTRAIVPETHNAEAYDYVLRGREQYKHFTLKGNARAQSYFKQAIELDPNYAAAYAGLAETYRHDWFLGEHSARERALELAEQAGSIDPSLPLVQEALGNIYLFLRLHD